MANNHMGDLEHGKRIVESFAEIVQKYKVNAAVKLQFRQLDTFIHKDFVNSDLKQVKRFKETRLSKHEFQELVDCVKNHDLKTCSTAFDNESISWLEDLDVIYARFMNYLSLKIETLPSCIVLPTTPRHTIRQT